MARLNHARSRWRGAAGWLRLLAIGTITSALAGCGGPAERAETPAAGEEPTTTTAVVPLSTTTTSPPEEQVDDEGAESTSSIVARDGTVSVAPREMNGRDCDLLAVHPASAAVYRCGGTIHRLSTIDGTETTTNGIPTDALATTEFAYWSDVDETPAVGLDEPPTWSLSLIHI